jgi:hypothetical protein
MHTMHSRIIATMQSRIWCSFHAPTSDDSFEIARLCRQIFQSQTETIGGMSGSIDEELR